MCECAFVKEGEPRTLWQVHEQKAPAEDGDFFLGAAILAAMRKSPTPSPSGCGAEPRSQAGEEAEEGTSAVGRHPGARQGRPRGTTEPSICSEPGPSVPATPSPPPPQLPCCSSSSSTGTSVGDLSWEGRSGRGVKRSRSVQGAEAPCASRAAPAAHARRSYTWRGARAAAEACEAAGEAPLSSARVADPREGDKEWAALTTWLRMNLHHPRTAKKCVLFVGQRGSGAGARWSFGLNPQLCWEDVSEDTRLRLRSLLAETESAFARKYPARPRDGWRRKAQKYRPPGASAAQQVSLEDLILSLHAMQLRMRAG